MRTPVFFCVVLLFCSAALHGLAFEASTQSSSDRSDGIVNVEAPLQDEAIRSGAVVLHAFMDGLIEEKEYDSLFNFENNKLTNSGWMGELMERAGLERPDGRALQKAIESDEKMRSEVLEKFDMFLDATHGLVANSSLAGWELGVGKGGFIDMGEVPLNEVTVAPEFTEFEEGEGYSPMLRFDVDGARAIAKFPVLAVGHTYVVRTGVGKFAKFHVRKINKPKEGEFPPRFRTESIELDWAFQPDGSRSLK